MKKILLLALPLMVMCAVSCEKEWTDDSPIIQFKDPKFLKAVLVADRNGDGQISEKEASVCTFLNLSEAGIRNLEEIKYFTALTTLYCSSNQLTSLDLSKNTALTELGCTFNQLTSLDLSNNTTLELLSCDNNQLTELDLSNNTTLVLLYCGNNQLTSLDVSNCTALTYLDCRNNQLTSLDLCNNRLIESLSCSNNPLQKLILYKYHILGDYSMGEIESEYGDIIEYVE